MHRPSGNQPLRHSLLRAVRAHALLLAPLKHPPLLSHHPPASAQAAIEEFAAPGSEVMFVGPQPPADLPQTTPKCSFHHVEGSPLDHNTLRRAGVAGAHAVLVGM